MFTILPIFFEHVRHVLLNRCPSNYQYIKIKVKEFGFILFLCIFVFIICIMTMYVCIYLCLLKYKFLYEFTNRYINTHINMQVISSVDKKHTPCVHYYADYLLRLAYSFKRFVRCQLHDLTIRN